MPITETIKKGQIKRKVSASEVEVLRPETEAEVVIYDSTASKLEATNVQAAIDEVAAAVAEAGKVDDIKIKVDSGTATSIVSNKIATIPVTSSYSGTSETIVNGKAIKAYIDNNVDFITNDKLYNEQKGLASLKGKKPTYPIYYDLEDAATTGKCSNSLILSMAKVFVEGIEKAGYWAGIYANLSWFNTKLTDSWYDTKAKWIA